ncbi:MAG TPA: hypothetical protein DCF63_12240 [Planctomycetaceae bacterium]|nr:hypothetical protein [Planctomycetaceae bacterium]
MSLKAVANLLQGLVLYFYVDKEVLFLGTQFLTPTRGLIAERFHQSVADLGQSGEGSLTGTIVLLDSFLVTQVHVHQQGLQGSAVFYWNALIQMIQNAPENAVSYR